jgi:L-ascorbate metabolism protein UlaG (beta-lactamase superfamily)
MKKKYPFYSDNKFYNSEKETVLIKLKDVIFHYIYNLFNKNHLYKKRESHNNNFPLSLSFDYFFLQSQKASPDHIIITPLGHATVFLTYKNKAIILDPLFNRSSFFFKRYANNIDINFLPQIDLIVYSHNHPDHYNKHDLLMLLDHSPHAQIIAPSGFDSFLKKEGIECQSVKVMTWWEESILFSGMIKLTALPAIHWSQSNIMNKNETLWSSWMITIEDNTNIYFGGDTAYGDHFQSIKENFDTIAVACIPIAPYDPKEIQIDSHMNVEESFQAFLDLGQPIFIPIHWGVFAYGDEPLKQPIEKIIRLFNNNNIIHKLKSTTSNIPYFYK